MVDLDAQEEEQERADLTRQRARWKIAYDLRQVSRGRAVLKEIQKLDL